MEDEYELVPINPIRKLEKRLDRVEQSGLSSEMIKELVDIVKTNQNVIDEIVKINSEMITKVNELSGNVKSMTNQLNDFMGRLEIASTEPVEEDGSVSHATESKKVRELEDKINTRLEKLEKRINAMLLSTMSKPKRMAPRPMGYPSQV